MLLPVYYHLALVEDEATESQEVANLYQAERQDEDVSLLSSGAVAEEHHPS